MIGQALLSIPLVGMLLYSLLSSRHSRIVAAAIALNAIVAIGLLWMPGATHALAIAFGLAGPEVLILASWISLAFLTLVDIHLKQRHQARLITTLTREIALTASRPALGASIAGTDEVRTSLPAVAADQAPVTMRPAPTPSGRRPRRATPETTLNRQS